MSKNFAAADYTHVIDCDAVPFVPDGWKVEEHIKGGRLSWNPDEVELYPCDKQKSGINGNKLRKLLNGKHILNACVLDYLVKNSQLIPENWKGKAVFFWGTIYRSSRGSRYVRFLYWHDDRWDCGIFWLNDRFDDRSPAALSCK